MISSQTTTDLQAVADAIREHDGYVLTTHENPDGDALGSLLATKLAFDALGKDSVMFLAGDQPLPLEYRFMSLDGLRRGAAGDLAGRCSPSTAATSAAWARSTPSCSRPARRWSTSTTTTTTAASAR
jgi:hypothetical protein